MKRGNKPDWKRKKKTASIAHKKLEMVFHDRKVAQIVVTTLFDKILCIVASTHF